MNSLFAAGFSTAAQITDMTQGAASAWTWSAGRSSRSEGASPLTSRLGSGTTVRLDLPARYRNRTHHGGGIGGAVFRHFPMDAVTETVDGSRRIASAE